jgi:hypothetical protein
MATLDDKLLGEKLHYYCSSSSEDDDGKNNITFLFLEYKKTCILINYFFSKGDENDKRNNKGPKFIPESEINEVEKWSGTAKNVFFKYLNHFLKTNDKISFRLDQKV